VTAGGKSRVDTGVSTLRGGWQGLARKLHRLISHTHDAGRFSVDFMTAALCNGDTEVKLAMGRHMVAQNLPDPTGYVKVIKTPASTEEWKNVESILKKIGEFKDPRNGAASLGEQLFKPAAPYRHVAGLYWGTKYNHYLKQRYSSKPDSKSASMARLDMHAIYEVLTRIKESTEPLVQLVELVMGRRQILSKFPDWKSLSNHSKNFFTIQKWRYAACNPKRLHPIEKRKSEACCQLFENATGCQRSRAGGTPSLS
jgi:hypothetical protein